MGRHIIEGGVGRHPVLDPCQCSHGDHSTQTPFNGMIDRSSPRHSLGARRDPLYHVQTLTGMRAICAACRDAGHLAREGS